MNCDEKIKGLLEKKFRILSTKQSIYEFMDVTKEKVFKDVIKKYPEVYKKELTTFMKSPLFRNRIGARKALGKYIVNFDKFEKTYKQWHNKPNYFKRYYACIPCDKEVVPEYVLHCMY